MCPRCLLLSRLLVKPHRVPEYTSLRRFSTLLDGLEVRLSPREPREQRVRAVQKPEAMVGERKWGAKDLHHDKRPLRKASKQAG